MPNISTTDIVILCGGAGTRFQTVADNKPKAMADILGKPFLDILLDYYMKLGFQRFVLCTGYMADYIKNYYQKNKFSPYVFFSEEQTPLGTGGAIKNAEPHISSDNFLVINGDSFCDIKINKFIEFHFQKPEAMVSMALTKADERTDTGSIAIDENTDIVDSYREKNIEVSNPYINTGIYIFNKKILTMIPNDQNCSLEFEIFPKIAKKSLYGYRSDKKLIDIGTPERYEKALQFFKLLNI